MLNDLRTVLRSLRRRPGFAAAAILTLALGVGANTTVFTVVNGVLFRPLAFSAPQELVTVWSVSPPPQRISTYPVSYPDFLDWRDQLTSVSNIAFTYALSTTLRTEDGPEPIVAAVVTEDYLNLLGVPVARGTLLPPDAPRAAVIKHEMWETRFGSDPDIIGRVISLDDGPYTVVGVLDPAVTYPLWADLFVPLTPGIVDQRGLGARGFRIDTRVVARMAPGHDIEQLRSELSALADRLAEAYPESDAEWQAQAMPMVDTRVEQLRGPLYAILGAVGFVLLIACTNVANLNLAAVLDRRREIAVRGALGEPTAWLVRRSLLESFVLAVAGGGIGFLTARWTLDLFLARVGSLLPQVDEIAVDYRVFLFTAAVIFVAAALSAVAPNVFAVRNRRGDALRLSAGIRGFEGGSRVQATLAAVQVGLTLVLLVGAGLLLRSFVNLQHVELGFDPQRLMGVRLDPPMPRYEDPEARANLFEALEQEMAGTPEMEAAALVTHMPLTGGIVATRLTAGAMDQPITARFNQASPAFFSTAGIPVVRGRTFRDAETRAGTRAVIISENLAATIFPDQDPVGASLRYEIINGMSPRFGETVDGVVVGVVGNVRYQLDEPQAGPALYVPATGDPWPGTYVLARARAASGDALAAMRDAIHRVDPDIPVTRLETIRTAMGRSLQSRRAGVALTGVFATMATALAAIGLFGVLSYLVRQRAGEIGLRMALGARPSDITRWVLRRAGLMFAAGAAIGLVGSAGATRLIRGMLFGVGPMSPGTIAAVAALLAAVMAGAAYLPTRRATRIDPMLTLRTD